MEFTRRETAILAGGDFCILIASLWVALTIRNWSFPAAGYFEANLLPFLPVFFVSIAVFYVGGLYEKQTRLVKRKMGERVAGAQIANTVIAALLFFVFPLTIAPKTILALYLIVSVIGVSAWRFYHAAHERRSEATVRAMLVAEGSAAKELLDEVNGNNRYLFHFETHIDPSEKTADDIASAIAAALHAGTHIVVIDTHHPVMARALPQLYGAMVAGVSFLEFASFYEDVFDRVPLAHIDHAWLLEHLPRRHTVYDTIKRAFDIVGAGVGILIALPFIAVAALLLRLSGGPAFIFNDRLGPKGRTFRLIKLRTMLINDHGDSELRKQNRVTRLGAFLRKSRIDELPQLFNVLVGELSFIGPRPELPAIAAVYDREIPYYQVRHLITPGLSGWAQIRDYDAPRGGADVEKTTRKVSYDLYYLKHRSLGLDFAIGLKTVRALLSFSGT
ncbi:MAG TPA: sugar transferase [Candidatus Paceibacterota bacterium]|nr:sugar transferase [Candidatus Paceibacterota bacterium]